MFGFLVGLEEVELVLVLRLLLNLLLRFLRIPVLVLLVSCSSSRSVV